MYGSSEMVWFFSVHGGKHTGRWEGTEHTKKQHEYWMTSYGRLCGAFHVYRGVAFRSVIPSERCRCRCSRLASSFVGMPLHGF